MWNLKERLRRGESLVGTMVIALGNPEMAKILKVSGFDFFIVDAEHGSFDYGAVAGLLALAREAGITPMVRIPEVRREVVLKYMEMGARGLLLPNAETVEQAKALVEYSKYFPLGNRGVSLFRPATGFEKVENPVEYMRARNEENILMVQIESPKGVQNVERMLDVEGIDAAFIGPNDLSQSMGIMGQTSHPEFIAAVDRVIAAARERKKFSGMHMMSADALLPWMKKGMTLNLWSNDVLLMMEAAKAGLAKLRNH
jgi:2-keto-3-deoxy-L-rhamnonate aldolase RhmA